MGRWSNAKRAEMAAKAAAEAKAAVTEAQPPAAEPAQEPQPTSFKPLAPRDSARDAMMDEIVGRHEKRSGLAEEPAPEATEPVVEQPAQETPPEATVEAAPAEPAPAAPQVVRVKVDGKEFDAPQSEVDEVGGVKAYQIIKAQENRLKAMNESLSQTKQVQAAMARWAEEQAVLRQNQQPRLTDDQFISSKIDVIRFGSPEESSAALKEVMSRMNPQVDPQIIMNRAVAQVRQGAAADKFKEEFPEIAANPMLYKLAAMLENETFEKLPKNAMSHPQFASTFDFMTLYRNIGNQIRGVVGRQNQQTPSPQPTAGKTSTPSEKEARKASIVALPTASARAELPKETKTETREDILNEMRKARGQPTE